MKYDMTWRNKWITGNAKSIDDMISSYEGALSELRILKHEIDAGKVFGIFDSAEDDYIDFATADKEVAEMLDFTERDVDDDDDDDDDDDEDS